MYAELIGNYKNIGIKSLMDNILKNGEMERLKEFNAKVSADEFKKLGFKGVVDQKLKSQFEGGAGKLAGSGAGMMSTITGSLKSVTQDTGLQMLEKLKPTLADMIGYIDKITPKLQQFGVKMADGFGKGINFVKANMPSVKKVIQELQPVMSLVISSVKLLVNAFKISFPVIKSVVSSVWNFIKPIISSIAKGIDAVANVLGKLGIGSGGKGGTTNNKNSKGSTKQNALGTPYYTNGTTDERGGEIKVYPNGTKVIPHDVSVRAMQGNNGGNTFNFHINGSNLTAKQVADELIPQVKLALNNM